MTAILPVIYKLSIRFTIYSKQLLLIARRFERLVQAAGTVGEGDDIHGEGRIVRGMERLPNGEV
ncbi:MAG: hypothetical protein A3H31_12930 [Gallionellales bacterium RIFCSPLOWO2_02_FULL_57_47]|nr:MAG: hypothetical protein A3H31_12930 [Gallionellales bacterium RIFCSPLOWO2_02_FULL_57_47]OGT16697.1 MAG: hypothetical protein A3J49_17275 [Gallionellales bacterium RIFCSPHIGHO2_02_FULL_57_16]